ncbi:uncharacterized protein VICG_01011 [Vittaforma corneae ATCC 50505]|uniref:Uncharacterized protein n=1 Tax=Vittaforma corneae (strain ATCC 50505) TaxID=993615 RepID=L2GMZ1_VITCO|nr:uncharacterized protein VICG_01011 [Vittaforma corneae ATCC 50505]ELA41994.1 hypothetical protein VICG_01011 [Vittaforma corneae ATCC 50505]
MFKEFHSLKLEHLRCLKEVGIVAAFGYRTCIVMNDELETLCRFIDANKDEKYYCGEFFENKMSNFCSPNKYFLVLGGETGVIKILDIQEGVLATFLTGHTGAVCDIKILGNHIVSSGEDSSIRIWSLRSLKCIGVCGGIFGHKDHILSIDILFDRSMIVSSGTDCVIKQWKIDDFKKRYLNYEPFTSFNNIHCCPISKIKYYGNMIVSLCNNTISMVFNNREKIDSSLNFNKNDPIFIGSIDLFNNCKTFDILGHILLGMGSNGDVYIFDLRSIAEESMPLLMSTNVNAAEDFIFMNDLLYISSGNAIHRIKLDLSYFNDKYTV